MKYFSSGDSDGAGTEYIYVNYVVNPDEPDLQIKSTKTESYRIISHETNPIYRSIVLSHPEKNLLSFSPPQSIPVDDFIKKNPEITDDIYINECIEGTMIHLFYDPRIESWEIATKSAVGANYWYYRTQYKGVNEDAPQRTFRQMVADAFRNEGDLNNTPFLKYLPKEYSYTFVLKHPANHIVQTVEYPVIYLVAVYHICDNRAIYIPAVIYEEWDCFLNIRGIIEFPPHFEDSVDYEFYRTTYPESRFMGYMMTNVRTGDRCHIENPEYARLRELRGNHANLQYQYLELRKTGLLSEFLREFPLYRDLFFAFYTQYRDFLVTLHQCYVAYYIKKDGKRCPKQYFPLIYKLHHQVFLVAKASGEKRIMRKNEVNAFLDTVSSGYLMHYMNYTDVEQCELSDL